MVSRAAGLAASRSFFASANPKVVLAGLAIALLTQLSSDWLPTRDGAAYLSIARSIASGEGPLRFGSPRVVFPPGYPALIAPAFLLSDHPFFLISLLHWLLAAVFLLGCYVWFGRQAPDHALLLTALSALNVGVLYYFRRTLSEAAFMPLLMWTAIWMDQAIEHRSSRLLMALGVAAVTIYLCATRFPGAALALGFAAMLLNALRAGTLSRRRAAALTICGVLLPWAAVLWLVYLDSGVTASGEAGNPYLRALSNHSVALHEQIVTGLRLRIQEIGRLLLPGAFKAYGGWLNPAMLLYVPLAGAVTYGWWLLLRRRPSALLFACPFYVGLYVIWAHDQGTRFMTPMVPALWASAWTALGSSPLRKHLPRVSLWLLIGTLATSATYWLLDRSEARALSHYGVITQKIASVVPFRAALALIPAPGMDATAFAAYCAFQFDRRCQVITARNIVAPGVEYVAALGIAPALGGFTPILQENGLTVLRRAR